MELRRYINRALALFPDLYDMTHVLRTPLNQHQAFIDPLAAWLLARGVDLQTGAFVQNIGFAPAPGRITVNRLDLERQGAMTLVAVEPDNLVLVTTGSQVADLSVGSMSQAPGPPRNSGRSVALWKRLAEGRTDFGNPDVFFVGGYFATLTGYLASPLIYASTAMGSGLLLKGFAAAAVGGVGSSRGALAAGLVIGIASFKLQAPAFPAIIVVVLVLAILVATLYARRSFVQYLATRAGIYMIVALSGVFFSSVTPTSLSLRYAMRDWIWPKRTGGPRQEQRLSNRRGTPVSRLSTGSRSSRRPGAGPKLHHWICWSDFSRARG